MRGCSFLHIASRPNLENKRIIISICLSLFFFFLPSPFPKGSLFIYSQGCHNISKIIVYSSNSIFLFGRCRYFIVFVVGLKIILFACMVSYKIIWTLYIRLQIRFNYSMHLTQGNKVYGITSPLFSQKPKISFVASTT